MARNKMSDLNDHLFEMMEKLNDDDLLGEDLERECKRADAMAKIGTVMVKNFANAINVEKLALIAEDKNGEEYKAPSLIEINPVHGLKGGCR